MVIYENHGQKPFLSYEILLKIKKNFHRYKRSLRTKTTCFFWLLLIIKCLKSAETKVISLLIKVF